MLARHERAAVWLRVWADLGRAPRTMDAYARGLAEYLESCERLGVDPLAVDRAHVASYVRELTERRLGFSAGAGCWCDRCPTRWPAGSFAGSCDTSAVLEDEGFGVDAHVATKGNPLTVPIGDRRSGTRVPVQQDQPIDQGQSGQCCRPAHGRRGTGRRTSLPVTVCEHDECAGVGDEIGPVRAPGRIVQLRGVAGDDQRETVGCRPDVIGLSGRVGHVRDCRVGSAWSGSGLGLRRTIRRVVTG